MRLVHLMSIATVVYETPSRYNWLFQFYLRAHGLALSWVGSGRLIFSHAYREADFEEVVRRFVAAAREMRDAGWWWCPPHATNARVRRQIVGEMLRARLGRGRMAPGPSVHAVRSPSAGSGGSPRSSCSGERPYSLTS